MRQAIKYMVAKTYKPLLENYLSRTRSFSFQKIQLVIPPEVFHPGFFYSTKLLLRCLSRLPIANKTFLELGAGSGLLSIYAAQQGAHVTASDINPVAISVIRKNAIQNGVALTTVESDLFASISPQAFDFILINPPYYKRKPATWKDYAWYCGENGEFFSGLFAELKNYIDIRSVVLMVVSDACDLKLIKSMAAEYSFYLECILKTRTLLETNFVYRILKTNEGAF